MGHVGRIVRAAVFISLLVLVGDEAVAKEGGRAWLMSPIPRWAEPGTVVHVSWIVRDDEGNSTNAIGMFVRFTSGVPDLAPNEGFATATAHPTGEYEADVVVPGGGIGRIEFGLAGTASGPNMTPRRSDLMFAVANLMWTPQDARPDGPPPPDRVTQKVTSSSALAGAPVSQTDDPARWSLVLLALVGIGVIAYSARRRKPDDRHRTS